jgi:hypothetical protein
MDIRFVHGSEVIGRKYLEVWRLDVQKRAGLPVGGIIAEDLPSVKASWGK